MQINSGTIETVKDRHGNPKFLATSELEPKSLECWTLAGAAFWLWLIETRVQAFMRRTGKLGFE